MASIRVINNIILYNTKVNISIRILNITECYYM